VVAEGEKANAAIAQSAVQARREAGASGGVLGVGNDEIEMFGPDEGRHRRADGVMPLRQLHRPSPRTSMNHHHRTTRAVLTRLRALRHRGGQASLAQGPTPPRRSGVMRST